MEGFIKGWIWEEIKGKMDPNQFGGMSKSSATLALIEMHHNWIMSAEKGKDVRVLLLDFAKAFDLVEHGLVILKLRGHGVTDNLVMWMESFLSERQQRIKLNDIRTEWVTMHGGMPQGTKLGPLCFVTHIDDLKTDAQCVKFMDDTTIYSEVTPGNDSIPTALQQVLKWSELNKMEVNPSKTKEMYISFKRKAILPSKLPSIDRVQVAKVLGVYMQDNLRWDSHIDEITKRLPSAYTF